MAFPFRAESDRVLGLFGIGTAADRERFGHEFVGASLVGLEEGGHERALLVEEEHRGFAHLAADQSGGGFEVMDEVIRIGLFAKAEIDRKFERTAIVFDDPVVVGGVAKFSRVVVSIEGATKRIFESFR